jgi:hypothetical protein
VPFIRLCDNYVDHPKFRNLSDGSFRLWHQGMAFCRRFQTDGYIAMTTVREFRAYSPKRLRELMTPWREDANPLWTSHDVGVRVHDYLEWNAPKDEENERRTEARDRMRHLRERRQKPGVPPPRSREQLANNTRTRSHEVLDRIGSDPDLKEKNLEDPDITFELRASRLLQELYPAWFAKWRHGAKLRLIGNTLEFQDALSLVRLWDDARLEKLAQVVLTTNEPFIAGTDRGFKIFALKASWADSRLAELESQTGVTV